MADISQGNRANLILAPGDVYRISTSGTATVSAAYGAPAGVTTVTASSREFGPYSAHAKLVVNAVTGSTSYAQQVPASPASGGGAGFVKNGVTGLAEVDIGEETFAALPVDNVGNVKGNVIPRTGNGAALRGVAGGVGELSSALDQSGVFKHTGVPNKAQYIGPEWVIDASILTNLDPITIPEGTTRVVVAFVASQTSAVASCNIQLGGGGSTWRKGHRTTIEFFPRNETDDFSVTVNGGVELMRSQPAANFLMDGIGVLDIDRTFVSNVDGRKLIRVGGGPTQELGFGPGPTIAIGNGVPTGKGSTVIGTSFNPLLSQFPNCGGYSTNVMFHDQVEAVSGVVHMASTLEAGVPVRLGAATGDDGLTSTYPVVSSVFFGYYRLTLMVTDSNLGTVSRFTREFCILPGSPTLRGFATVGTDLIGAGITVTFPTPTIDGQERLNVTITCSTDGVAVAFLEYLAA